MCSALPAVSYTHLDVYKRQAEGRLEILQRMRVAQIMPARAGVVDRVDRGLDPVIVRTLGKCVKLLQLLDVVSELRIAVRPVSYTHLDVYKRQSYPCDA